MASHRCPARGRRYSRVILVGMWLQITAAPSLHRSSDHPAANRTVVLCATASHLYIKIIADRLYLPLVFILCPSLVSIKYQLSSDKGNLCVKSLETRRNPADYSFFLFTLSVKLSVVLGSSSLPSRRARKSVEILLLGPRMYWVVREIVFLLRSRSAESSFKFLCMKRMVKTAVQMFLG